LSQRKEVKIVQTHQGLYTPKKQPFGSYGHPKFVLILKVNKKNLMAGLPEKLIPGYLFISSWGKKSRCFIRATRVNAFESQ